MLYQVFPKTKINHVAATIALSRFLESIGAKIDLDPKSAASVQLFKLLRWLAVLCCGMGRGASS